jgi:hypothetical protein
MILSDKEGIVNSRTCLEGRVINGNFEAGGGKAGELVEPGGG